LHLQNRRGVSSVCASDFLCLPLFGLRQHQCILNRTLNPEQALQFLRLSLQCAVPLQTTEDENRKKRTLTTKAFTGDARSFVVTGKSIVHTSDPQTSSVSIDDETFTFTAGFAHLSGVTQNNNSVTVTCSKGACIRKVSQHNLFPVPNCTRPGCDDAFREKQFRFKEMTLVVCDEESAENAKFAIEHLIKPTSAVSPFNGVPLILGPTR
jgi:hypothetical protein